MSRRLGKGLAALIGEYSEAPAKSDVQTVAVASISPNPMQPRRVFTDDELAELASSIRENGLLQPLVVRPAPDSEGRFELIAGERRFRAVRTLEWSEVPVVIREATDETLLVLALVENLQREALNPIEEAEGYQALSERFGMSQADIAGAVGKDRSTVANFLRLLKLPPSIRKLVDDRVLDMGHARALLAVPDPTRAGELARRAASEGWSVREVERRAKSEGAPKKKKSPKAVDPIVRALEEALREHLSTRVSIRSGRGGQGTVEIKYHGSEDFERIFELITDRSVTDYVE